MDILEKIGSAFQNFSVWDALAILVMFFIIFFMLKVLKENNATRVIWIYIIFTFVSGLIFFFADIPNKGYYFIALQCACVLCVLMLFATEVKRAIWNRRFSSEFKHGDHKSSRADANTCIDEIIKAVQNMSKNDIGAIIILSNSSLPSGVLESGVFLDAEISSQLIESIFFPKTALHDGAMILDGTRIQAAGCFLPLAQEVNLSKDLGSRHRAGIGLTETVNVTAIIVSEETGIISIAKGGKIIRYVDTNVLRETLKQFYWQELIG